jgi:hypothetical protein
MIRTWPADGIEAVDAFDVLANARIQSAQIIKPLQPLTAYKSKALVVRSDGKTPIWAAEKTFTTGEEVTPADVPDNSVGMAKLVQEARNRMDQVFNDLPDRILQVEAEMARQADANLTQSQTDKKKTNLLKAAAGSAIAAVIREEAARVEDNVAFAMALLQVSAEIENFAANGMLEFRATAGPGAATQTIALMGRAQAGDDVAEGGLYFQFTADGHGGTTAKMLIKVDELLVTDGVHTSNFLKFDAASGRLTLKELMFEKLTSLDGVSLQFDGTTGISRGSSTI